MVAAISPIHEALVAGVAVRFFAPPAGRDDLPWHSFEDLAAAAQLSRSMRDELLGKARRHADTIGIATLRDGTVIESHNAAIALIGAMLEIGAVPASFATAYSTASVEALRHSHDGLTEAECYGRVKAVARTLGVDVVLPS